MDIPVLVSVGLMVAATGGALGAAAYGASLLPAARGLPSVTRFAYFFLLTVAIQLFHYIEHIAQVVQAFALGIRPAHGLIGQLDLEQVHFVFNTMYLAMLVQVLIGWLGHREELSRRWLLLASVLAVSVLAQSYHMVEHTVKLTQFIITGRQGTPGILGAHFNGIVVHFMMNTAVFLPIVYVFLAGGVHRRLQLRRSLSELRAFLSRKSLTTEVPK